MFDIKKDIQAMTSFRRNPAKFMKHLKETKKPLVLAVNGKAEAVVQGAEVGQSLLDIAARVDAGEGIRQGLEDVKRGRKRAAREALMILPKQFIVWSGLPSAEPSLLKTRSFASCSLGRSQTPTELFLRSASATAP
jgi:hypothetical protein